MEEEREGGIEEEEEASKQHIYICISTLDLVIRQRKKPTASKNTLGALHLLRVFQQHKH